MKIKKIVLISILCTLLIGCVIFTPNSVEDETKATKDSPIIPTEIIRPEPTTVIEVNDGNKLFLTEFFDLVVSDDKETASKFTCQCIFGEECEYAIEVISQDFDWKSAKLKVIELEDSFIVPEDTPQDGLAGMDVYAYTLKISKDSNITSYPIVLYTSKDSSFNCIDIDG